MSTIRVKAIGLGAAISLLAALAAAPAAHAEQVSFCGPNQGKLMFYVLDGFYGSNGPPLATGLAEYHNGPVVFSNGDPASRVVHERGANLIEVICDAQFYEFNARFGINWYQWLGGELYSVWQFDPWTWNLRRLGTLWYDAQPPYATGGSVGIQDYYGCFSEPEPAFVNNSAAWHTGLDRKAMDGPEDVKETEYFSRVQELLRQVSHEHMAQQPCEALTRQQWFDQFGQDVAPAVHYDLYDPQYGVVDQN